VETGPLPGPPSGLLARGRRAAGRTADRLPDPVARMLTATVRDIREMEVLDRAMTLAAQAFTSLFPLVIAIAALRPGTGASLGQDLADVLSSPEGSRQVLEQALPGQPRTIGAFGVAGVLIVLISATSFSRALARMYGRIWRVRPPGRVRGAWRWLAALIAVAASVVVLSLLRAVWSGVPYGTVLGWVVTFAVGTAVWTWTPYVLLGGAVDGRRLLPGGALMGLGTVATTALSGIYLPRALTSASRQYGALGIAFTYISWLFVVMTLVVATTVVGAVIARERDR
jgi:membrane protein